MLLINSPKTDPRMRHKSRFLRRMGVRWQEKVIGSDRQCSHEAVQVTAHEEPLVSALRENADSGRPSGALEHNTSAHPLNSIIQDTSTTFETSRCA